MTTAQPMITPRQMDFPFDPTTVPKYWFGGNATASLRVNSINLLFPDGERFFVRSVRRHMHRIDDPQLRQRARQFFAQESLHGHEHDRATEVLEAQGFEIKSWLKWYQGLAFSTIESRAPALLCLSVTAALEHLTASLAHYHLTYSPMRRATPVMQDLMRWHASEEIEHKSVAFDVFTAAGGTWIVRTFGMVLALIGFLFFWESAFRHLRRQDPFLNRQQMKADIAQVKTWGIQNARRAMFSYAIAYFRPSFHPDDVDDYPLAAAALRELTTRYNREPSAPVPAA